MNCVFTNQETKMLTKNIPVSREGRELLQQMRVAMAESRMEQYNKMMTEVNEKAVQEASQKGEIAFEFPLQTDLSKFTPSVSEVIAEKIRQNKLSEATI